MTLTTKSMKALIYVWGRTKNLKWWQPKDLSNCVLVEWIECGFMERCDARFGAEAIKDAAVRWTEAGRLAMSQFEEQPA